MCGIAGIFERDKDNRELMSAMLDAIRHRGPDDKSVYVHGAFTLGHRRLSIIDLETGNQPLFNEDRTVAVVFNGEIYNHRALRDELEASGHRFYTRSDTEVLVHLYEEHGTRFFDRLDGIFALALLDTRRGRLVLARDHFGVKPLHYYLRGGLLLFGSEQKSIILHPSFPRQLNHRALHLHLNLRYTPGDETLLEGVKRLPPAHYAVFEEGLFHVHRYWQLPARVDRSITEADALERVNALVKDAVRRQLMSDVPLGVYLSGGLDSAAIVQKMHELGVNDINTFTLGFNEPGDEFDGARLVADRFHTRHHPLALSMNPMRDLPAATWHAEEPKINLLQGFHLSALVRPVTKVVLAGMGGDELFAGYDIHRFIYPFNRWHRHVPRGLQRLARWKSDFLFRLQNGAGTLRHDEYRRGVQMLLAIGDVERFYLILRNAWDHDDPFYRQVYAPAYLAARRDEGKKVHDAFDRLFRQERGRGALDQVLRVEFQTKMVNDYLLTEDRVSMAHSVEERVPLLDRALVEFAFSLPVEMKIRHGQTKYLFRRALAPHLPPAIVTGKKRGFAVNPYLQFKKDLKETAARVLTREYIERQGIFNHDYIRRVLDHPPHPRLRWHYNYLWILVGLAIWEEQFLNGRREENIEAYYK
jgi:asparagine synthase (glutamine-hydrolysing)